MSLTVEISVETEVAIKELAAQNGRKPEEYAGELLAEQVTARLAQNGDDDSQFFTRSLAKARTRTPAEIAATREKIYSLAKPPRPLPENQTVFDAVYGKLQSSDESDAEVLAALQKLS